MVKKQQVKEAREEKLLGVEDSGRGPVIGPLIMAGVMIPSHIENKFKEIGVKDSKMLTPDARRRLAKIIKANSQFEIIRVWPYEIDFGISSGVNLNTIEAIKAAQIINDMNPDRVIIDCPSPNIKKWQAEVEKRLQKKTQVSCEHKADVNHPVVSAASIIAKVARDEEIAKIQKKIPINIGSGYPSDPATQKFIKGYSEEYHEIFRKSWKTWKNNKKRKAQKAIGDF